MKTDLMITEQIVNRGDQDASSGGNISRERKLYQFESNLHLSLSLFPTRIKMS